MIGTVELVGRFGLLNTKENNNVYGMRHGDGYPVSG
jgi:hypothetical protein